MHSMLHIVLERSRNRWRESWKTGFSQITLYRLYAIFMILLTPLYGQCLRTGDVGVYEPMSVRWLFAVTYAVLLALSYMPGFFQHRFVGLMHALTGMALGWIVFLAVLNNLAPNHAITYLVTTITFLMGTGVGSRSLRVPLLYVGIIASVTFGTLPFAGPLEIEPHIFTLSTITGIVLALTITGWALRKDRVLAESHHRYQMFIRNSTEGIWRLEMREPISIDWPQEKQIEAFFEHAYIAEANAAQAKMYGVSSPDTILGLPVGGLLPPNDEDNRNLFRRVIRNGYQMKDAETKERTIQGTERWFLNNIIAEIEDGKIHRLWGIQRDITAQKQAETARALSEQKLALHAERSPMGFIEWNLDNEVIGWNKAAENIFGFTAADVLGRSPINDMVPPHVLAMVKDVRQRVIQGRETAHDTNTNLTKDGVQITCEWFNTPLIDMHGTVIGMASLVHDVTEREHMTDALLQSQQRYHSLFQKARAAIIVHDLEGTILEVNQSALDLFGFDEQAIKTLHVRDLHPQSAHEACRKHIEAFSKYGSHEFEIDFQRQDGSTFLAEVTVQMLHLGDTPVAQALIRDQTQKRLWAERMLQAQRLESLGTLAGGIAHDLNNALNPVLMGLDMLRRQTPLSELADDVLESMESSAIRGAHLIKQVLEFSQGVAGHPMPLSPETEIREFTRLLRHTFPRTIDIQLTVKPPLPTIFADTSQFRRVLMNICVNARDAMPKGGILTIGAETTHLSTLDIRMYPDLEAGAYLKVDIADTGIGMTVETKQKLFEPFYTTKANDGGPGLGLSVVLGIVRQHGGAVHAYSEKGTGTSLSVFWPVYGAPSQIPSPLQPASKDKTILVVDDEPNLLDITQQALELEGYTVVTAVGGREAWTLFRAHPTRFDLIFTDMMMPDIDGPTLISHIRDISPSTVIISTSGLDVPQGILTELDHPHFLPKPYRIDQLLDLLANALT